MQAELKDLNRKNLQRTYLCEDLLEKIKQKESMFMTQTNEQLKAHRPSFSTLEKQGENTDTYVNQRIKGLVHHGKHPVEIDFTKLTIEQKEIVN